MFVGIKDRAILWSETTFIFKNLYLCKGMQTQNTINKRNFNLWVGTIILSGLIICIITKETSSTRTNTFGKKRLDRAKSSALFKENGTIIVKPSCDDIYEEIKALSIDESITILNKWCKHAQKIIPQFPDFPKIWLLPPTDKGIYRSKSERYSIEFMQLLFPSYEFKQVRPCWLRNPETNRCLELDGYCEELSLAIEYNGVQHYEWPNFLPMTKEQFFKQCERDQIKAEICIERNICLLRIPYTVPYKRLPLAIYAKLLDAVPNLRN